MSLLHAAATETRPNSALDQLQSFIEARRLDNKPVKQFEEMENEIHALFAAAECEVVGEELAKFDVDVPVVEVEGISYRQVLRCSCCVSVPLARPVSFCLAQTLMADNRPVPWCSVRKPDRTSIYLN